MPTLEDIFTDGPEHLSRTLRRAGLRRRLRQEEEEADALLAALGAKAWELEAPSALELPPANDIRKISAEIAALKQEATQKMEDLQKQIDDERIARDQADSGDTSQAQRLEELQQQKSILRMELDTLEIELRRTQSLKENLRSELDSLNREAQFLELSTGSPQETIAPQEIARRRQSVETEIGSTEEAISAARAKVTAKRAELEPVEEEIFALEAEINRIRLSHQRFLERVSELEKQKEEIESGLKRTLSIRETKLRTLFRDLGSRLLPHRPEARELEPLYVQIDLNSTTHETIASSMKSETTLIDLLDRKAVLFFYWIAGGSAAVLLALIIFFAILFAAPRPF